MEPQESYLCFDFDPAFDWMGPHLGSPTDTPAPPCISRSHRVTHETRSTLFDGGGLAIRVGDRVLGRQLACWQDAVARRAAPLDRRIAFRGRYDGVARDLLGTAASRIAAAR